jgi:uncharacterized protein GlcG (DUF336 family)
MTAIIHHQELSYQTAMSLAVLVADYAEQEHLAICISILCPKGKVLTSLNMNKAPLHSAKIALDKAYTSASFGLASHSWKQKLVTQKDTLNALSLQPNFTTLGGGFPLIYQGEVIAAIGVSGASEKEDMQCAQIAINGLSSLLEARL